MEYFGFRGTFLGALFKTTEAYNACNKKGGKCLQFHEGNSNVVLQVFQNIWNVI